jgi:hypothetical protein
MERQVRIRLSWIGAAGCQSLGLSLSLISVTIVWTTAFGLKWTPALAWIAMVSPVMLPMAAAPLAAEPRLSGPGQALNKQQDEYP